MSSLSSGSDRGSFMTRLQVMNIVAYTLGGLLVGFILGQDPPLALYTALILSGIVIGITSALFLGKVPEPGYKGHPAQAGFFQAVKVCAKPSSFRLFMVMLFIFFGVSAAAKTFVVVYSRQVFNQSDGMIVFYGVIGYFGYVIVGSMVRRFIDKKGSGPLLFGCSVFGLGGMLLLVLFSHFSTPDAVASKIYLSFIFFVMYAGFISAEGIMNIYFLNLIPEKYTIDMGIVYYFIVGAAGVSSSFLAGVFIDFCGLQGFSPVFSFRLLYIILGVFLCVTLVLQKKLPR
jgi:Na+/melibiose symporter-like transporter